VTKVVLEIKNPKDWQVLLPLLRRLKIQFTQVDPQPLRKNTNQEETLKMIQAGLPVFDNFEEWMQAFEKSRKDRPLPFREN
jgi:hypothetical protein